MTTAPARPAHPTDTVENAAATPDLAQPFAELGLKPDEYQRIRDILEPPPHGRRARHVLGHVVGALLVQVEQEPPAPVRRQDDRRHEGAPARRHRRERGRRRHRRRLGRHVQGRVAQPPVLRRAVPGRGHGRRRHRARHHLDGRAPGRRHGPAAVRRGRPPRHRPRRARRGGRRRRLRQLARPAEHRRRARVRRVATRATRWSTRCASACCGTRTSTWPTPRARATRSSCSVPARVATASAARRSSRARRSTTPSRPSARRCRWATRSWRRCSSSAASSSTPRAWSRASRTWARPASPARRASWPPTATAACTSTSRTCCCATPR